MAKLCDALALARDGVPVFPLKPDKSPYTPRGFKDASADPDTVTRFWELYPNALVGVPTGKASGLFVLDVDRKNGVDGSESLRMQGRSVPLTRTHTTQSGGIHYLFRAPTDKKLKSTAGKVGRGVDTRGDGGYIVWWPAEGLPITCEEEPAEVPEWLVRALDEHKSSGARNATGALIAQGQRETTLVSLAGAMRRQGATAGDIAAAIRSANGRCVPPLEESALLRIATSVSRYDPDPDEVMVVQDEQLCSGVSLDDFLAYLPEHKYIYRPTRTLWPASAVNSKLQSVRLGNRIFSPSKYLDRHKSVEQATWHPAYGEIINGRLAYEGGWVEQPNVRTFNFYRPPAVFDGNAHNANRWRDHLRCIYPEEAAHLELWFAHHLQYPGEKVNHGIVLGGEQGIGKDSVLEPIKRGVGPWNFHEVSPAHMLGSFNPWVRAVILRINEGHDLGDVDRFKFYDHCKTYLAAPPDVLICNRKHMHEVPVFNVMGVILTTNHRTDGVYLPQDDRRHFVAWSEIAREHFSPSYWSEFWQWLEGDGTGNVIAYLRSLDLSRFDSKAPPPKTAAWHAIVNANIALDDQDLSGLIEMLNVPEVITVAGLLETAQMRHMNEIVTQFTDNRERRKIPHRLERVGYVLVPNPDSKDGFWRVAGRRSQIYGHRTYPVGIRIAKARDLCRDARGP